MVPLSLKAPLLAGFDFLFVPAPHLFPNSYSVTFIVKSRLFVVVLQLLTFIFFGFMQCIYIIDLLKNNFRMVFNPFIHNTSDKNWTFGRSGFKGSGLIASRFFSICLCVARRQASLISLDKHPESVNL